MRRAVPSWMAKLEQEPVTPAVQATGPGAEGGDRGRPVSRVVGPRGHILEWYAAGACPGQHAPNQRRTAAGPAPAMMPSCGPQ
jgi:hypothetical protein